MGFQTQILEWVAISSFRGSSWPRGWNLSLLHWQAGSLARNQQESPWHCDRHIWRSICVIANIRWIIERAREFHKNICFIDCTKAYDWVDHNKLWKILKEKEIPDHLTGLPRNLYAGQETAVRTGHGTTDWFQIGKGVLQGCVLSPCLFTLNASCEMPGWMKHKLESRLLGEISVTSDMQMTPP